MGFCMPITLPRRKEVRVDAVVGDGLISTALLPWDASQGIHHMKY